MCVHAIAKSGRILAEGIGFLAVPGFAVSATMAAAASLTDKNPLAIRVQGRLDVHRGRGCPAWMP